MAAREWSGFEDGDMEMDFAGAKFKVHRAIIAQASPVWKAMLTGTFAESTENKTSFDGDDPKVARLCIEIIYSAFADGTFDWADIESRVMSDRTAFDAFVDKYDLRGVKRLVLNELHTRQETRKLKGYLQVFVLELDEENRKEVARLTAEVGRLREVEVGRLREVKRLVTKPGTPVNIHGYAPDIGTRVKRIIPGHIFEEDMDRNQWYKYHAVATVIAVDGHSVTVRWKKGGGVRSYNPAWDCLEYA